MSDGTEKPDADGGWVPSAEHPVPPTTEFSAVAPEGVEPIDGPAGADETPATGETSASGGSAAPAAKATVSAPSDGADASSADTTDPIPAGEREQVPPEPEAPPAAEPATEPATPAAAAPAQGVPEPPTEPPAWKTPPASGLPPQWGDPSAEETGPQGQNDIKNLWGLVPEDRPEVLLGVALAGGVLAAILVRTLARR